jgi:hypothetical protein
MIHGITLRIVYYFKYKAHKLLYQKYSLLSAGAFETDRDSGGRHLDALLEYYNAFHDYKNRAMYYLQAAWDFEIELIPEAAPSYLLETGKLLRNMALLNEALPSFDPVWEKGLVADAYTEIALIAKNKGDTGLSAEAAERLFALNHGALRQNGIRLPVQLEITGESGGKNHTGALKKAINSAGFDIKTAASCRWTLRLRLSEGEAYVELYDGGTGIVSQHKTLPLKSLSAKDVSEFANTLAGEVF